MQPQCRNGPKRIVGEMLSFFTVPKPFVGHIGVIQENALRSWRAILPDAQIIVFGNEAGTAEISERIGLTHEKDIETNSYGTPLLDAVFRRAQQLARFPLACYVNTDIILPPGFAQLPADVSSKPFLAVGSRWDMNITQPLDVSETGWFDRLQGEVEQRGSQHEPSGSDYFLFRGGDAVGDLLPFAVGRPGWDNWMIYHAYQLRVPIIDATRDWQVIHQNHDYAHVPDRREDSWEGPEADENRALLGDHAHPFTLHHATHRLQDGRVRRRFDRTLVLGMLQSRSALEHIQKRIGRGILSLSALVNGR
jgi:hypothetical protein